MSKSDSTVSIPKSIRQKRILDVAAEKPDAAVEELAEEIPSATADLVENVLEEYGDPADDQPTTPPTGVDSPDAEVFPAPENISTVQRETLQAIREYPEATQQELSNRLEVAPATISNRVNAIPNFEWSNRVSIATTILSNSQTTEPSMPSTNGAQPPSDTDLRERVETLENQLDAEPHGSSESAFDNPEFAYKILRACMNAEEISEDEERRLFIELYT